MAAPITRRERAGRGGGRDRACGGGGTPRPHAAREAGSGAGPPQLRAGARARGLAAYAAAARVSGPATARTCERSPSRRPITCPAVRAHRGPRGQPVQGGPRRSTPARSPACATRRRPAARPRPGGAPRPRPPRRADETSRRRPAPAAAAMATSEAEHLAVVRASAAGRSRRRIRDRNVMRLDRRSALAARPPRAGGPFCRTPARAQRRRRRAALERLLSLERGLGPPTTRPRGAAPWTGSCPNCCRPGARTREGASRTTLPGGRRAPLATVPSPALNRALARRPGPSCASPSRRGARRWRPTRTRSRTCATRPAPAARQHHGKRGPAPGGVARRAGRAPAHAGVRRRAGIRLLRSIRSWLGR